MFELKLNLGAQKICLDESLVCTLYDKYHLGRFRVKFKGLKFDEYLSYNQGISELVYLMKNVGI